ncbi:MAG: arsenosugar biosynthesis radical SAM protein ArsS [Mariprofundaceae bacterium]
MHAMQPLLEKIDFPRISRGKVTTLQVNLGYLCNQSCLHCHVNAGPKRKELMDVETMNVVLDYVHQSEVSILDLTGGAPEMNPDFKDFVLKAKKLGVHVIDRCNLTILEEPGYEDMALFLAENEVEISASLPCYLEDNVDAQRGDGVFSVSIKALKRLNALGYGQDDSNLMLNLVYNPQGTNLPPSQAELEADYKREMQARYDIVFNQLFTITNIPIQRFGSTLVSKGEFEGYMQVLQEAYQPENLESVMCRSLLSVDWQGYVYDCDFNQMLNLSLAGNPLKVHLRDLMDKDIEGNAIAVMGHCYACTAGQGSSCGGAL